ncbi:MAG: response regulator transcription factor [Rhodocyclaceae bacterium]|nr:response regulator transcription factor [Rhodocyclaceae bacterium]
MNFAVIEDSRSQAEVLKAILKGEGHHVDVFADGGSFIEALKTTKFDFFVLDWILPDMGGDEVLKHIRQTVGWDVPVIFCTSRTDEDAASDILRMGADDYMAKPLRYMEFMARVHRLLQRGRGRAGAIQRHGAIEVDAEGRRIRINGSEVDLTQREYDLAIIFLDNVGRVLPREELMSRIWERDTDVDTRTVDTHASRLRKKLGLSGESGMVLTAVYGQGYRLDPVSPS